MVLILKEGSKNFITGRAMDFTAFLDENIDIHHIFPRAYAEKLYKREKWNSIVNKTPLFARTNRILSGYAPSVYLDRIERADKVKRDELEMYLSSHLIDVADLRNDDFNHFFTDRAKKILDLISMAMGKTISNRDSDETIAAFGDKL